MEIEERFATAADGTRLWWRAGGGGLPALVLCDGIACAGFAWRRLFPSLAERHRVLHWNYRGHGRTERPADLDRVTLLDCVDDLFHVLDAAGERSAVLVGHSMGVQVCLEAHRRAPRRVRGLVLVCGAPGRVLDTFHGRRLLATVFPYLKALVLAAPGAARWWVRTFVPTRLAFLLGWWLEVNRRLLPRQDLERYLSDVAGVDVEVYARMLASAAVHDASDHLGRVDVPTLVVAGERDTFTPLSLSIRMHASIPGSELLVLPAGTHTGLLEHPELVARRVERFIADHALDRPAAAGERAPGGPLPAIAREPCDGLPAMLERAGPPT